MNAVVSDSAGAATAGAATEGTQAVTVNHADSLRTLIRTRSNMGRLAINLPLALLAVQHILDNSYELAVSSAELAEKNKGGEYSSSAFTINGLLTEVESPFSYDLPTAILEQPWTLNGLPVGITMQLAMGRWNEALVGVQPLTPGAAEPALNANQSILENDGAKFLTTYAAFTATFGAIRLNGYEQAQYLRHLLKWAELNANPATNAAYAQNEYNNLLLAYTLFLIDVLRNHLSPKAA